MDKVRMVFARPLTKMVVCDDRWQFKPVKLWSWLQRAAWWFLTKTKALSNPMTETIEYKEIVIDRQSVSEQILAAMDEMNCLNVRPSSVLMGPDSFDNVCHEMRDAINFTVPFGFGRSIFDLPVTIIPWMRGVVVLPKGHDDG